MKPRVRTAGVLDLPALAILERASFAEPWELPELANEIDRPEAVVHVAEAGGKVVGYAIWRFAIDEVELLRIGVDPQSQRQGLGGLLVASGLATANERGSRRAHLEVRVGSRFARRLYERHGFVAVRVRRGYYSNGEDAAIYSLELG